jgi:DNA-binding NarL/FixJ family response regulator
VTVAEYRTRPASVLVVDDHPVLAHGLAGALRDEGFEVHVVDPLTRRSILETARAVEPDIVLLDVLLGDDVGDSIALVDPLTAGGARVVMLTGMTDEAMLGACVEAGAVGVLSKTLAFDELLDQVVLAARGHTPLANGQRDELLGTLRRRRAEERERLAPFERLTGREREVLASLMEGLSAEQIARRSFVSITTVRSQIRAILEKLGVHSQTSAVAFAHRAGWDVSAPIPDAG